jgi:hypothetical protein
MAAAEKNTKVIKDIMKKPYNKVCFDCGQKVRVCGVGVVVGCVTV